MRYRGLGSAHRPGLRQGVHAVRAADRPVPGRQATVRGDAHRSGAGRGSRLGCCPCALRRRRHGGTTGFCRERRGCHRARRGGVGRARRHPGARRHRLHVGARRAPLLPARALAAGAPRAHRGVGGAGRGTRARPAPAGHSRSTCRTTRTISAARSARTPDISGPGASAPHISGPGASAYWPRQVLFTQALTIGGGTTDFQLNIIAVRLLGLPRDPAPATDR